MQRIEQVTSPCIRVCELDASGLYCAGCFRTLAEISGWGRLDNQERLRIVASTKVRKSERQKTS